MLISYQAQSPVDDIDLKRAQEMRNVSNVHRITNTISSIYHRVPTVSSCTCPHL